jgi:hypothetical protein
MTSHFKIAIQLVAFESMLSEKTPDPLKIPTANFVELLFFDFVHLRDQGCEKTFER